ncbi:MAG: serine hydrolase domain-containing protein, partial [Polyangiaceae bacterium]
SGLNMDDPEHMATMTLTHCLTHSSGLADYLQVDASHEDSGLAQFFTGTGALTWGKRDYFSDPPGSFYDYANPNFMLAGYVLEKVGGVPYRTAVHDRVLAPLGMNRTVFLPSEALADGDTTNGASTDANGKPWDVAPDSYDNSWARPAGYAFSSVLDYEKFLSFLLEGNTAVLPDDLRAKMQSAVVPTEDPGGLGGYGFGIENDSGFQLSSDYYDVPLVSHNGAIPGYATEWYLVPSTGFGIVAFANADGAYFGDSVALAFKAFADLPASTTPTQPAQDPEALAKIAGDYVDPHNVGHVTVSLSGTSLSVSMPDLDKASIPYSTALSPEGNDNFSFVVQGQEVEITFLKDGGGAYTWMRARPFVATRTALAADGGAPLPVPFPGPPHLPTSAERHPMRPAERLAHAQLPAR